MNPEVKDNLCTAQLVIREHSALRDFFHVQLSRKSQSDLTLIILQTHDEFKQIRSAKS